MVCYLDEIATLIPARAAMDIVRAWGTRAVDERVGAAFGAALCYRLAARGDVEEAIELLTVQVKRDHPQFDTSTLISLIVDAGDDEARGDVAWTLDLIAKHHPAFLERALDALRDADVTRLPRLYKVLYNAVALDARVALHPTVIKAALAAAAVKEE